MPFGPQKRGGKPSAREQLAGIIKDLVRARYRQILVDRLWGGLFWGLAVSCAAVLAVRLGGLPYTAWATAGAVTGLGLLIAVLSALPRRPDPLRVAILTDLRLNLKEVVSTAWEFSVEERDPSLAECLAAQALHIKYQLNPERLFPLHVPLRGKLVPLLAALLLLVGVIDLQRAVAPSAPTLDPAVASEGARLQEYGRQMERRARRKGFFRSVEAAERIQGVGKHMQTARLSRRRALSRLGDLAQNLDDERRAALSDGLQQDVGPLELESRSASSQFGGLDLRELLESLLQGRLKAEDVAALQGDASALSRLGVTPQELENALESFAAGDAAELREMLEKLSRAQQALREADELGNAREEVDRAREKLGETVPRRQRPGTRSQEAAPVAGEGQEGAPLGQPFPGYEGLGLPAGRAGSDPGKSHAERRASSDLKPDRGGDLVQPEGQARRGRVYTSEARVLPRPGRPEVEEAELEARFTAQMEEVLSKEDYPLHFKEYIRRYFLAVSQGVPKEGNGAGSEEQR